MIYTIRHSTRIRYSTPVTESVSEVRLKPLTGGLQRCLTFQLNVTPNVPILQYEDYAGNVVSHFNIPFFHNEMVVTAQSVIGVKPSGKIANVPQNLTWEELDHAVEQSELFEWTLPSKFAQPTDALLAFSDELKLSRNSNPLFLILDLNQKVYKSLLYLPNSTRADSPIDEALTQRAGVCQDYSHIMIALIRNLGIPCRYVSGYLFHAVRDKNQSPETATHAWLEAWFPGLGWIGLDPTNNKLAGDHHIIMAYGKDYAEVPPTRGVFKGECDTELSISVRILPEETRIDEDDFRVIEIRNSKTGEVSDFDWEKQQIQQKQQQQ